MTGSMDKNADSRGKWILKMEQIIIFGRKIGKNIGRRLKNAIPGLGESKSLKYLITTDPAAIRAYVKSRITKNQEENEKKKKKFEFLKKYEIGQKKLRFEVENV